MVEAVIMASVIATWPRVRRVTAADVARVAQQYLTRLSAVMVEPPTR
jgi:hypothetical protein